MIETPLHRATAYVRNLVGADFLHLSAAAAGAQSRAYRANPSPSALRGLDEDDSPVPRLVYTVNDARPDGLSSHLASIGAAGIFTDDPVALRALWPHG